MSSTVSMVPTRISIVSRTSAVIVDLMGATLNGCTLTPSLAVVTSFEAFRLSLGIEHRYESDQTPGYCRSLLNQKSPFRWRCSKLAEPFSCRLRQSKPTPNSRMLQLDRDLFQSPT